MDLNLESLIRFLFYCIILLILLSVGRFVIDIING